MAAIDWANVQQRLEWDATPQAYDQIRTVWLKHSIRSSSKIWTVCSPR